MRVRKSGHGCRAGNLPRFGPLLPDPEGGRRRLNVAVTRARQKLTVVSSFSHLEGAGRDGRLKCNRLDLSVHALLSD